MQFDFFQSTLIITLVISHLCELNPLWFLNMLRPSRTIVMVLGSEIFTRRETWNDRIRNVLPSSWDGKMKEPAVIQDMLAGSELVCLTENSSTQVELAGGFHWNALWLGEACSTKPKLINSSLHWLRFWLKDRFLQNATFLEWGHFYVRK